MTPTNTEKSDYNFNYLNLPLLVSYNPVKNFRVLLGPEVGYLLSARIRGEDFDSNAKEIHDLSNFDVGIATGLDYQFGNGLGIGIRYVHGFIKIQEDNLITSVSGNSTNLPESTWRNRTFQLYISYAFLK